jgi:hypothetical protein
MRNKIRSVVNSRSKYKTGTLIVVPVVVLAIVGSIWFSKKTSKTVEHRDLITEHREPTSDQRNPAATHAAAEIPNKPKFESPIFQTLQKKDWEKLAELLAATTPPVDTKLTQLIYFLDTKKLDADSGAPFFKTVMTWVDASNFNRARESQLLSHVLGKLKLNSKEKKKVEATFAKNGWNKKRPWTQVSVSWVPVPESTFQELKMLLQPGRSDMTADFVHFVSKMNDKKAKKKLLALAKSSMPKLDADQQLYLTNHLKTPSAIANPNEHREQ